MTGTSGRTLPVSIHAPAWGATTLHVTPDMWGDVSIHAPAWGATSGLAPECGTSTFQSTPPRGGRRRCRRCGGGRVRVSIHAPAWGATAGRLGGAAASDGFNPRPRVGGDWSRYIPLLVDGAFQSTPPRGGRLAWRVRPGLWFRFNPRPRVGGDARVRVHRCRHIVSIHAPAWGATVSYRYYFSVTWFQSTPPRGGRPTSRMTRATCGQFQSTPPRGGRRHCARHRQHVRGVSIHAPAWGATGG